ncbi:MAG: hypothetical protein K2L18_00620, partial [Acetatifactor sp.]|nr:hypothetical protein [Acetatifactor sp.]
PSGADKVLYLIGKRHSGTFVQNNSFLCHSASFLSTLVPRLLPHCHYTNLPLPAYPEFVPAKLLFAHDIAPISIWMCNLQFSGFSSINYPFVIFRDNPQPDLP